MKWLIYPYSPKFVPVIKYGKLSGNDSISAIVAPMGFALNGKSAFIWEAGGALSIKSEADVTEEYDGIWITPEIKYMSDTEIVEGLSKLELCNKTIYYSAIFNNIKEEWLFIFLRKKGVKKIIQRKSLMLDFTWQITEQNMYKIDTPIIMIAGDGENSQKFEIQLYLRKKLVELGYKTSQIGTSIVDFK